ncbi:AIPR family protein [uncultured Psychroserpens sp.]|uniref:AIPR family protein n=1 Tax=uncultured Psychroserpens sp. TaxID=255436 RepID=UPI002621A7C5|nr:AIPR family protein [uncultured Psychroserpens sp.]
MNVNYPEILQELEYYNIEGRTESASFLMWYLEKYFRLDQQLAIDSVCDNKGDKGVDGIYLNEGLGTIDIFQTKIVQSDKKTIGDSTLKEFIGTIDQFTTKEKLENLIKTAGKAQVASLIKRLDLLEKLDAYKIRGIFVTNVDLSNDGEAFLNEISYVEFFGKTILEEHYISDKKEINLLTEATFDVSENETTKYYADAETITYIAPIKAGELVMLEGINDQSIFDYNVRGALGNTKINKGIVRSIKDTSLHKQFPLFHNGITIVAENVDKNDDKLTIKNFYVVNGCQSLTSLYRNKLYLTDDLKILTKVIKVPIDSTLSSKITEYSNSQNGVKPRDFKSYNQIQIRLQNEISGRFGDEYYYEIKRGDKTPDGLKVISNESMGVFLMSFDIEEPWNTHRKYQVFEDAYNKLFARPEVTAYRIIFIQVLDEVLTSKMTDIENQLIARYALTKYALMYITKGILLNDETGKLLIKKPNNFVKDVKDRNNLSEALSIIIDDIIIDLNAEVGDLDEDFDYKSSLRNDEWVKKLNRNIVSNYLKQIRRKRIPSFKEEWERAVDNNV